MSGQDLLGNVHPMLTGTGAKRASNVGWHRCHVGNVHPMSAGTGAISRTFCLGNCFDAGFVVSKLIRTLFRRAPTNSDGC